MDEKAFMKIFNFVYNKSIEGVPGAKGIPFISSVEELAKSYMKGDKPLEEKVDTLTNFQVVQASATGFLTGVGGPFTLPIAIPANLAGVLLIQTRMVATIAYMGGYDVKDDRVKTFCLVCLCGDAAAPVMKEAGITIGTKITEQIIRNLSGQTIQQISKAVSFRILTKFGQSGAVNLGKAVPVIGGLVGAAVDGATTSAIGEAAKRTFIEDYGNRGYETPNQSAGGFLAEISFFDSDDSILNDSTRREFLEVEEAFSSWDKDTEEEDEGQRKNWWEY